MGLSRQTMSVLQKPQERARTKEGEDTKGSRYIHLLKLNISPLLRLCAHTNTQPVDFVIPIWESCRLIGASLTNILWDCAHRWLMYSRCGFLFVPDLQHFGRSVDSNKGLLNNRFHSPTQEGPAWPRGVSCSFEHLNPPCKRLTSLCYIRWWMFLRPCFRAHAGKAPADRARGAFSRKRSSR